MTILCCQVGFFLRILWAFCPLYTDLRVFSCSPVGKEMAAVSAKQR